MLFTAGIPRKQWQATRLEVLEDIRCEDDLPANICFREFQKSAIW